MTNILINKIINKEITNPSKNTENALWVAELISLHQPFNKRKKTKKIINLIKKRSHKNLLKKENGNETTYDRKITFALPWKCKGMNEHIPSILGADEYKADSRPEKLMDSDVFFSFGIGRSSGNLAVESAAKSKHQDLFRFEYGFISSLDIALKESPQHSAIICPKTMYYDATQESSMERDLNDDTFFLSSIEKNRANNCIKEIKKNKITKYNHSPLTLPKRVNLGSNKKKVLLVDQRYGDASIEMGLANQDDFVKMWHTALSLKDHDVIVKLHPDAISGGKESCLSKVLNENLPENVYILKEDVNPYAIFDVVDKVFVCVSQMGLEALFANKEVHCFGVSFYSGYGLTIDYKEPLRKRKRRTLEELFHIYYIEYSRYYTPTNGRCEIEDIIKYFSLKNKKEETSIPNPKKIENNIKIDQGNIKPRVVLVIPSARFGATGRYFQDIAIELKRTGCDVLVLSEAYEDKIYNGISWVKIEFDGIRLSKRVRDIISNFSPTIVYENGVRSRAQRAALEIVLLTKAKLVLQSEDDDIQVYQERHPNPNHKAISCLDKKEITKEDLVSFINLNDWEFTLNVLADPEFDRWVEPLIRSISYSLSSFNTAIWYPFEKRLKEEFGKPTLVVPPVINIDNFPVAESEVLSPRIKDEHNIPDENIILFLGGTIYDYSPEFNIFLESINLLCNKKNNFKLTLAVVSGRSNLNVSKIASEILDKRIHFIDLGSPNDELYMNFLKQSDIICSPGLPDRFNLYRLPSRLVKAMALGKAVLTCRCGFGESLTHEKNAIIFDGETPEEWVKSMDSIFDGKALKRIGLHGRRFAEDNFDVKPVTKKLKESFQSLLDPEFR